MRVLGVGQVVEHNHIHHAPHQGIELRGNDHLIQLNEVACASALNLIKHIMAGHQSARTRTDIGCIRVERSLIANHETIK